MTLLILSDSHGHPDRISEAIRRVRPDGILFAGDGLRDLTYCDIPCPLWVARGNCDRTAFPLIVGGELLEAEEEMLVTVEGVRILLTHGHRYGVKSSLGAAVARASLLQADALVYGHTHLPVELHLSPERPADYGVSAPLTVFNPGSIGDPSASFGTLTIRNGRLLFGHGEL